MAGKFLDDTGLAYFWNKIKSWVNTGFLKLTGGTLTGGLSGTSASFSGDVGAGKIVLKNGAEIWETDSSKVLHFKPAVNSSNQQADFTMEPNGTMYHRVSTDSGSTWSSWYKVGETVTVNISTAVSVSSGTNKSIGSITLTPGVWVISYGSQFTSNANGNRGMFLYTSADTAGSASYYRHTLVQGPAASGNATYLHSAWVQEFTESTTLYLTIWHSAGTALNCYGAMRAARIW